MRVFFTSFGQRSQGWEKPEPGQLMPPMIAGNHRLHFDIAPLFFSPRIIMDRTSLEAMLDASQGLNDHGRETLQLFSDEGLIETQDFRDLSDDERSAIAEANSRDGEDRAAVAAKALRTVDDWFVMGRPFAEQWSAAHANSGIIPYAYNSYLRTIGKYDDLEFAFAEWEKLKRAHEQGSKEAIDALVSMGEALNDHHNTTMFLSNKFQAASYHWRNLGNGDDLTQKAGKDARQMTEYSDYREKLVVEALVPGGFEDTPAISLTRMLQHKKMAEARKLVKDVAASGMELPDEFNQAIFEATEAEANRLSDISEVRKLLRIPKFLAGFIPGGSDLVDEGGSAVAEMIADKAQAQAQKEMIDRLGEKAIPKIPQDQKKLFQIRRFVSAHQKGNEKTLSRFLSMRK